MDRLSLSEYIQKIIFPAFGITMEVLFFTVIISTIIGFIIAIILDITRPDGMYPNKIFFNYGYFYQFNQVICVCDSNGFSHTIDKIYYRFVYRCKGGNFSIMCNNVSVYGTIISKSYGTSQ